jgi:fatty acyl-CoA reductase
MSTRANSGRHRNINSNSFIEEKVYETEEDVDKRVSDLLKADIPTDKAISGYPNTYTYTKWLSERMLLKRRPKSMTMTIIRPTIVTVSLRDPMPGWVSGIFYFIIIEVDNLIGGAAIYFYSGIGLVKYFKARGELIGD